MSIRPEDQGARFALIQSLRPDPGEEDGRWSPDTLATIVATHPPKAARPRRKAPKFVAGACAAVLIAGGAAYATGVARLDDSPQQAAARDSYQPDVGSDVGSMDNILRGERLDAVAKQVRRLDSSKSIAGVRVDDVTLTVDVYWAGEPPASLLALRESIDPDLTLAVHRANYSMREMGIATKRVWKAISLDSAITLYGSGRNLNGSGLTLHVSKETFDSGAKAIEHTYLKIAGMPVTIVIGSPIVGAPLTLP
ncbi:hypothetical protein BH09ACT10_BH09ACT10_15440 [soil metagenome]